MFVVCLSCLPEYVEMTTGYKSLTKRVSKLEKEKVKGFIVPRRILGTAIFWIVSSDVIFFIVTFCTSQVTTTLDVSLIFEDRCDDTAYPFLLNCILYAYLLHQIQHLVDIRFSQMFPDRHWNSLPSHHFPIRYSSIAPAFMSFRLYLMLSLSLALFFFLRINDNIQMSISVCSFTKRLAWMFIFLAVGLTPSTRLSFVFVSEATFGLHSIVSSHMHNYPPISSGLGTRQWLSYVICYVMPFLLCSLVGLCGDIVYACVCVNDTSMHERLHITYIRYYAMHNYYAIYSYYVTYTSYIIIFVSGKRYDDSVTSFRRRASFIFTVINLCPWLQEELRNSVTKIRKEQQLTIKVLRNDIETAAAVAAAAASQVPADYAAQSHTLAFDRSSWNHLASLSEQIALLEERIEGCE